MKTKSGMLFLGLVLGICLGFYLSGQGYERSKGKSDLRTPVTSIEVLLKDLPGRKSWQAHTVKIWLDKPICIVEHKNGFLVEAWPGNENDYNVPMIRVDKGDHLFQITENEYSLLKQKGVSGNIGSNEKKVSDPVISPIQFSWSKLKPADVFDIDRQVLLNRGTSTRWDITVPVKELRSGHRSGGMWFSLAHYVEPDELRGAEYLFPASSVQREDENQSRITGLFVVEEVYGPRQGILYPLRIKLRQVSVEDGEVFCQ